MSEILGQQAALGVLLRAVQQRQPSHAYLFHGPESVGKAATARAFARALLCGNPVSPSAACGNCPSCRRMESGNHPDFRLLGVQRAGTLPGEGDRWEISIDQIRQNPDKPRISPPPLITDAFYRPILGEWKIYVIDPADLLSEPAGSALLKLLEEPPAYVVIILVAARPAMVLPTLRSRCWPVGFRLVAQHLIEEALLKRGCAPAPARLFAALAEGRIGWAIVNVHSPQIETARRELIQLLSRLPEIAREETLCFAEKLREIAKESFSGETQEEEPDREEAPESSRGIDNGRLLRAALPPLLDLAIRWFRDLLLISSGAEELIANEDHRALLTAQSVRLHPGCARACLLALLETKRLLQRYVNPILATESLAVRLRRAVG